MKRIIHEAKFTAGIVLLAGVILLLFLLGNSFGGHVLVAAALGTGLISLLIFSSFPHGYSFKLLAVYSLLTFVQMPFGSLKFESVRGASLGNILVLLLFGAWVAHGHQRGKFMRRTPFDFWLPVAIVLVPGLSLLYTSTFESIRGYSFADGLLYLKNTTMPFFFMYVIVQLLESRKELRTLYIVNLVLLSCAVLFSLPFALQNVGQIEEWRGARTAGAMEDSVNTWANLMNEVVPYFLLLTVVVARNRPGLQTVFVVVVGGIATSLVATMSRGGMVGFGMAVFLCLMLMRRAGGRVPIIVPACFALVVAASVVQFAPDLAASATSRFSMDTFRTKGDRKSYTLEQQLNRYSGDRLELWKCAYYLWEESPFFGVGYRVYRLRNHEFHKRARSNAPHSMYMGALANGGILYLLCLAVFFWKLWKLLYSGARRSLETGDDLGLTICGGAWVSTVCFLVNGLTYDAISTSNRLYVICFFWGIGIAYSLKLAAEEEELTRAPVLPTPGADKLFPLLGFQVSVRSNDATTPLTVGPPSSLPNDPFPEDCLTPRFSERPRRRPGDPFPDDVR